MCSAAARVYAGSSAGPVVTGMSSSRGCAVSHEVVPEIIKYIVIKVVYVWYDQTMISDSYKTVTINQVKFTMNPPPMMYTVYMF